MEKYASPDPARQELAVKYENTVRKLTLIQWLLTGIVLLAVLFSGVFTGFSLVLSSPQPWISAVFFILLMLAHGLVNMPFTYY